MQPFTGRHAHRHISLLRHGPVSRRKAGKASTQAVKTDPILVKMSAVLIEEDDCWSARCLEYDVAARARSLEALQSELQRLILSHLSIAAEFGRRPFENIPPAPQNYWGTTSSNVRVDTDTVSVRAPGGADAPEVVLSYVYPTIKALK